MESQSHDEPKLSLDLSPPWLAGAPKRSPEPPPELRDYVSRLEAELRKIQAFRRELPLSVLLLGEAIGRLKEEASRNAEEVTSTASENGEDGDKKSWMSSAQLWSSDQSLSLQLNPSKPRGGGEGQVCEYVDKGGAFPSFKEASEVSPASENPAVCLPASPKKEGVRGGRSASDRVRLQCQSPPAMMGGRKQRRCWSPELHRRFVDALERLGGSQVATPKQIRELMQVNDLTNDEVKSHLQKYRLHMSKRPNTPSRDKPILAGDSCLGDFGGGATTRKAEVGRPASPREPPNFGIRPAKFSAPASKCDSMEDDYEEKSDSHSWGGD